ncbi:hypothetical protein D3C80_1398810 [compost metagenome]
MGISLLHQLAAQAYQFQCVGKTQRAGDDCRRVSADGQAGHISRRRRVLQQQPGTGDTGNQQAQLHVARIQQG